MNLLIHAFVFVRIVDFVVFAGNTLIVGQIKDGSGFRTRHAASTTLLIKGSPKRAICKKLVNTFGSVVITYIVFEIPYIRQFFMVRVGYKISSHTNVFS